MRTIEQQVRSFFEVIIAHPRAVLAICLLCTVMVGWQARHFQVDASADTLLMRKDPNYLQTQIVSRRFSPREYLLAVYVPKNHPLLSARTFKDLRTLSEKLGRLERVESVRSILNVPLFAKIQGGVSGLEDLSRQTLEHEHYSMVQIRAAFAGHPLYEDLLINKRQTATALQVLFKPNRDLDALDGRILDLKSKSMRKALPPAEAHELATLKKRAEQLKKKLDRTRAAEIEKIRRIAGGYAPDAQIFLGGIHVLGYELIRIIKNDLMVFGGAITAMIGLTLLLLFRKLRWVFVPIICCGCSALATMGLFGLLGFKTTVISSNFIVLQLILTLAVVIHLIVQYREYAAAYPETGQAELVRLTLLKKAGPCFYAGLTTAVGFASLLFSAIEPVITFGWMMIIAMFFSIGTSLVMFPAVAALLNREKAARPWRHLDRMLGFCSRSAVKHPVLIAASAVGILAAAVTGLMHLKVENSFINYFWKSTRIHQELTFIDRQFGGSTPLDIVYTIPVARRKKDLIMTAGTVLQLQRIQHALQQHPAIGKTLSVINFMTLAKQANAGRPLTEYELTALYWTMQDTLRKDLLGAYFDPDRAQVRFSIRIKDTIEDLNRSGLLRDIRQDMQSLGISEDHYRMSNLFILYEDILQKLFSSQILTMGIVYGVLALTFMGIFRSVKIALIGIAPNILSTLVVLGVMGWLGIALDLMTITISAIAMGIAVDDTLHYIHRYLEELEHAPAGKAAERCHVSVGYAIVYTSFIIILGFSLLAFSNFVPSVLFGLLTGLAMLAALVFVLSLLPVLLIRFAPER